MKTDIVLCGVGGQGVLSIATILGQAATDTGINLKQAEIHGMSQRGGRVQSDLRLSTEQIWSDLIPLGGADLIISMEPMEALRYLSYLNKNGRIITGLKPVVNITDYPDLDTIYEKLNSIPGTIMLDIESIALQSGSIKSSNMVLLGAAAKYLEIFDRKTLEEAIRTIFAPKGEAVVEANIKAFENGYNN